MTLTKLIYKHLKEIHSLLSSEDREQLTKLILTESINTGSILANYVKEILIFAVMSMDDKKVYLAKNAKSNRDIVLICYFSYSYLLSSLPLVSFLESHASLPADETFLSSLLSIQNLPSSEFEKDSVLDDPFPYEAML